MPTFDPYVIRDGQPLENHRPRKKRRKKNNNENHNNEPITVTKAEPIRIEIVLRLEE